MTSVSKMYDSPFCQSDSQSDYYMTPTMAPKQVICGVVGEGVSKQWCFLYTHILHVNKDKSCVNKMKLALPTYIETAARINHLKGDVLIIVNSPNIGRVHAKTVVLWKSQAEYIAADDIYLFYSRVEGAVLIKNKLQIVSRPPPSGVESSVSYTNVGQSKSNVRLNDEGKMEVIVEEGSISNPTFTEDGKPLHGTVVLASGCTVKEQKTKS